MVRPAFRAEVEAAIAASGVPAVPVYQAANGYEAAFFPDLGGVIVSYQGGPAEWGSVANVAAAMRVQPDGEPRQSYGAFLKRTLLLGGLAVAALWIVSAML